MTSRTHWPYSADTPQRYSGNYHRYTELGGPADVAKLVAGFTAGGENTYDMARFFSFCLIFDQLAKEGLAGDIVELGAYQGHSATMLAAMARRLGKTAYILDTFEGFHPDDLKGIDAAATAETFNNTSLAAVRNLVGEENTRFVKGYFPETASQLPDDGRYCLVHLDCDLYAPIISGLAYFYPRVVPGGFLIIHDYSSLCWNGAEKAVDEFLADKPEAPMLLPDSGGSVVIRRNRNPDEVSRETMRRHAALLSTEWVSAARGGLHDLLGQGWSASEHWGVWGVGESHELRLTVAPHLPDRLHLQADVAAVLMGRQTTQRVAISVAGQTAAVWEFTPVNNRGVRDLEIPLRGAIASTGGYRRVTVLFHPASTESPKSLAPELTDDRPLGMSLHRLRYLP